MKLSSAVLFLLVVFAESFSTAGMQIKHENDQTIYQFSLGNLEIQSKNVKQEIFRRPQLQGVDQYLGQTTYLGRPELPVIRFYTTGRVASVDYSDVLAEKQKSSFQFFPVQPSQRKDQKANGELLIDKEFYQTSGFWPEKMYDIEEAGSVQGHTQWLVTLYPLRVNALTGETRFNREITVNVIGEKQQALNSSQKELFLFVVGERFQNSSALKRYIDLKKVMGYYVETLIVDSRHLDPSWIRGEIIRHYHRRDMQLKHVLIVGDIQDVPAKPSQNIQGVTDHYYRAIDRIDYESDVNGSDIGLGRISVDSEDELNNVVNKYIRYISGRFNNEEWLSKVSFIASDDRYDIAERTHDFIIKNYMSKYGYKGDFPQENILGGDQLYSDRYKVADDVVVSTISRGRSIIEYSGHGAFNEWIGPRVTQTDIKYMRGEAMPFVIAHACVTGDFTHSESFAETWQRHPMGAITYWGSIDRTYWDEDDILEQKMYEGIFNHQLRTFQDITSYSLSEFWKTYGGTGYSKYYWESYTLFGDPSIRLRLKRSRLLHPRGSEVIPVGTKQVQYQVLDERNQPVSNVRVAFVSQDKSIILSSITDVSGNARIDLIGANSLPNDFSLTLYGDDAKLVSYPVKMIPADKPHLVLQEAIFNGRRGSGVYVGEMVDIKFKLMNLGLIKTSGGMITVEKTEGPIRVLNFNASFSEIIPGSKLQVDSAALKIAVSEQANYNDQGQLRLKWTTLEGSTGYVTIFLTVLKARLTILNVDTLGGVSLNSLSRVKLVIQNSGSETIFNGNFATEPGECISQMNNRIYVPRLEPYETVAIMYPLDVVASPYCQLGQKARFRLVGTYESLVKKQFVDAVGEFVLGIERVQSQVKENLHLVIPDKNQVIIPFNISSSGPITGVSIKVHAVHPFVQDLIVALYHPDGTRALLRLREADDSGEINVEWGFAGVPHEELDQFLGKDARGEWKLVVIDDASGETGALESASLKVRGYLSQ